MYAESANKTKYDFNGLVYDFSDEIVNDDNQLLSPRVSKFTNNDDSAGMEFTFKYDRLGRYTGRAAIGGHPESSVTYKKGTYLKDTITYKSSSGYSNCEEIKQAYDSRGNITEITTEKCGTTKYVYNDINQLYTEENEGYGFTRKYNYNDEGNISSVEQDNKTDTYEYDAGRLMCVRKGSGGIESYTYDNFGNPTCFKSNTRNMYWERGTLLKQYNNIKYFYDGQGKLYRKENGGKDGDITDESFYDGDKLIIKEVRKNDGNKQEIRFFYDLEGVAGFKISFFGRYTFIKDGQGNVIGLYGDNGYHAKYIYDAWGNCKALDESGREITDWNDPAVLNPFRWKSQYYDNDTKLYWIGDRWYDPERGRYISSASPEMLLQNASVVFGLNLYGFSTNNPVNITLSCGSINPSLDFYYNGEYKSWWDQNKNWVLFGVGVAATILACVFSGPCGAAATAATIGTTLCNIATATIVGAAISLAIGGAIAGIQSAMTGHGFWEGFADSVTENFVDI